MSFSPERALALLKQMAGPEAELREHQLEAIEDLVAHRRRVLVVQRTGWGKSAVYFIATRMLRDDGAGPTILVSPLLALMRNQITMAERIGIRAATINSANRKDWDAIEASIMADEIDLLLISPERLNNPKFRQEMLPSLTKQTGLLVIDEAHCISDWGHDFRPDYRRLARVVEALPRGVPLLASTATASDRVVKDIEEQLGNELRTYRGSLDRESLVLYKAVIPSAAERYAWLAEYLPQFKGSGIVYCLTQPDTERLAQWLVSKEIDAVAYHGDSDQALREEIEARLLANDVKVVVATSALGMGFDKPDLAFVVHYQSPGSAIAYYQQVGRAGRAVSPAFAILLTGVEDRQIQDYFIDTAFPDETKASQVVSLLEASAEPLSTRKILESVNLRTSRLDTMLKILEVEGAVERLGDGWTRTGRPWSYDRERAETVTALRRSEQAAMAEYVDSQACSMEFLRQQLDDPAAESCGRCGNCRSRQLPNKPDQSLIDEARRFLREAEIPFDPRKQFPDRKAIPANRQSERGRAVAHYGHQGLGSLVEEGKYRSGHYADELVEAAVELVNRWRPGPSPRWVTCVPSQRHPELVPDLARRVAERLGLGFLEVVEKVQSNRPQKEMENSSQQWSNCLDAFEVRGAVPDSAVLLIDDIVDSGWTLTAVGMLLRKAGSGPVHPLALATASAR